MENNKTVETVLEKIRSGKSYKEILAEHRTLESEDIDMIRSIGFRRDFTELLNSNEDRIIELAKKQLDNDVKPRDVINTMVKSIMEMNPNYPEEHVNKLCRLLVTCLCLRIKSVMTSSDPKSC